jgi:outer membrane protein OmpA-like peptidoglycan-associated protein
MSFRILRLTMAALLATAGGAAFEDAHAQGATLSQSGTPATADCGGGWATLNGSGNAVTFHNDCQGLTVNGSGNTVQIELKSGANITVNGSGNRVTYTSIGGTANATVADHGQGNAIDHVSRLSGGSSSNAGGAVAPGGMMIQGSHGEQVKIGPGGIVAVPAPGTGSSVSITPGGITTAPGGGAVAMTPGQLMFNGDGQKRDMQCSGATVYINGSRGEFILRGGCKALYIRGDNNVVHVELVPGAEIGLQGSLSNVYVTLTGAGPSPRLLVSGTNNHAFLVRHIDDSAGDEIAASVRTGALFPPVTAPGAVVAAAVPVIVTPQAALDFARAQSVVALQRDLGATQTPEGTAVSLSGDVLFDFDRDQLRPDAQRSLAELAVLIARAHPRGLQIVGYTDSIGSPNYNRNLSDRRARNVAHWLTDYGRMTVSELDVEGRGASNPVDPNTLPDGRDNPAGRQKNRRVEVLLQR